MTWWTDVWLDETLAHLMGVVVWMAVSVKLVLLFVIAIPCVCWWNAGAW